MAGEYQKSVSAKQEQAQVAQNSQVMTSFKSQISQTTQAIAENKKHSISFQKEK